MGAAAQAALDIGLAGASQGIGIGMGMLTAPWQDRRQVRQQEKLTKVQEEANKRMADYTHGLQYDMWNKTNYGAQMEHLKAAGLNPGLIYGMSGGGGTTTGSASAGGVSGGSAAGSAGEAMQGMGLGLQAGLMQAQKRLMEAQATKAEAEATKTAGVDTQNTIADTELKVLNQVIQDFAGKEAKDMYERVKAPNRAIEAKTYQDEMEARQGVAGTIYELWQEGKLKEKSLGEIEGIALGNAKTRAEKQQILAQIDLLEARTKGQNLENIILDLEAKLQTQTGLDRNSPGWMKVLGRLFVGLFGGIKGAEQAMK